MTVEVAVNLLWCVPGKVGGSEQYLARQLDGLGADSTEFAPTIYSLESFVDAHPELADRFTVVTAPIDGADRVRRVFTEHTWLARRTRSADLVHHGGGTAPSRGGRPIVLTVHDLQYETYPRYTSSTKLRYLRTVMPRSVARSTVVAVPTEYVRGTVVGRFGIDPERVLVVPHGVEPDLGRRARSEDQLRADYGLGEGPVLVLPAITHPHKGHRFLLDVLDRHWTDPDLRLVFIGGPGAADADVREDVERRGLGQRVVFAGRVDDAERDGLIQMADALVFPSEYEGFGAPVVEAMALDTPVICSDQPALSEVVADAGLVLPLDHDAWADALERVAREGHAMRAAGRRRAQDFTTRASGAGLAEAYRRAVEIGP